MEKQKNIFIKIDEFIFQKIDFLKTDPSFQKMNELLSGLEEKEQKLFAQIITFTFILTPYIFVLFLWWGNHTSKVNMGIKSQILDQISTLNGSKETRSFISASYLSPVAIQSREDLEIKIQNLMASSSIDQNKVRVLSFNQLSSSSNISKIEGSISFENFGTLDFSSFIQAMVEQDKFKITRINMNKNKNSNLLNGDLSVIHLGKTSPY